jgi:glucose/arabinose dehydrogenase
MRTAAGAVIVSLLLLSTMLLPGMSRAQDTAFDPDTFAIDLTEVTGGLAAPTTIANAGDGSGRLFVTEGDGTIAIIQDGTLAEARFLDITDRVGASGSEQGLLGLAFAPDFTGSRHFYVDYTDLDGNTVISRFTANDDLASADPASEEIILQQDQPYANHNGGQLAFGPDGYLYIGLGDGGSQGDPNGNGQNLGTWLGKILRIDVNPENAPEGQAYAVPDDNPFVGQADAKPEIWAYGLRNPWRFSFDSETGDLYIADVGQSAVEEIDVAPAGEGGQNYGWNLMEGSTCYADQECDAASQGLTLPALEYTHDEGGCSVTGGYVYRGDAAGNLAGVFVFGDYCSGYIWGGGRDAGGDWQMSAPVESGLSISTFGQGEDGQLYVADIGSGTLYAVNPG